ncbi:MAG: DUF3426 domain-containing protein [Pseudomonadota bacterium]
MLLATQCPHCFTSFRVANDQLKLHAGLVRCGACQQTFNGIEHLLAPGAKPALPPAVAPTVIYATEVPAAGTASPEIFTHVQIAIPEAHPAEVEIVASFDTVDIATTPDYTARSEQDQYQSVNTSSSSALEFDLGDDATFTEAEITVEPVSESSNIDDTKTELSTPIPLANEDSENNSALASLLEQAGSRQEPTLDDEPDAEVGIEDFNAVDHEELEANAITDVESFEEEQSEENVDAEKPDFVIQAEKKQRRSRLVRVSMMILSTLLFFALLVQATYSLRNQIAAWFPQSKSALQEACKYLHCRIELPTQIEVISIESNELQALSSDKNIFYLAIQLQNKSNTLQAWPMLELILNDAKDKPVLQRVFTPAGYLTNKNDLVKGLPANSEQAIKLYFELSGPKAAGYHVGVFYP